MDIENNYSTYNIDYHLLSKAIIYYNNLGFKQIETPYIVPKKYSNYTKPNNNDSFELTNGKFKNNHHELVGSGEQGFIYLMLNNKLKNDKYLTITPCFRDEKYDILHQPWFVKLELYYKCENESKLHEILYQVKGFLSKHTNQKIEIIKINNESFDLNINNIEVASIGIRKIENHKYIYATGLALPRFKMACLLIENNIIL